MDHNEYFRQIAHMELKGFFPCGLTGRHGSRIYRMDAQAEKLVIHVLGDADPPRGFSVRLPVDRPIARVLLNGMPVHFSGHNVRYREWPANIVVYWQPVTDRRIRNLMRQRRCGWWKQE